VNFEATILVIEDEPGMRRLLGTALGAEGYRVVEAGDGRRGLIDAGSHRPDLAIVDLGLPDTDGVEVIRRMRAWSTMPILVLSARAQERSKVEALDAGADDYVTKPFSLRELSARVRAALRRGKADESAAAPAVYRGKHLTADFDAVAINVDGEAVRLTRREFELLRYLVENRNRVLSRDRLLERVWGYDRLIETRSVDVHVGRLRGKLGEAGKQIETVVGLGYRFVE
jgi:DNA-binding response OmpR family regulator